MTARPSKTISIKGLPAPCKKKSREKRSRVFFLSFVVAARRNSLFVRPVVPVHDDLVGPGDGGEAVGAVERLGYVLRKNAF